MEWYLKALKKYATFEGRARRKEYWFFALFNFLIMVGLALLDMLFGVYNEEVGLGLLSTLYWLGIIVPSIAVGVRRLHDIGKSGWWLLIGLIPLIGTIVILVFAVFNSQPGDNQYGPNPKSVPSPGVPMRAY